MPSKEGVVYLLDIKANIGFAFSFVGDLSAEEFEADIMRIYATTRALEIISEASRRLPPKMKARHPQIRWHAIAAAGNVYRHEYDELTNLVIWDTVHMALPPLKAAVEHELTS